MAIGNVLNYLETMKTRSSHLKPLPFCQHITDSYNLTVCLCVCDSVSMFQEKNMLSGITVCIADRVGEKYF